VTRDQVFEFFRRLAEANPSPTTELESTNPYQLLVAVVLSAQATDASVNIATKPLFAHIKTPKQMVDFGEERLREAIKTFGLFNTKAKNVIALSQALIDGHGSEIPRTRDELQELPGVGRKTANVVLNTAFGVETFAVDTHVFRVCNRTGLAPGNTVDEVEAKLEKNRPAALPPRRSPLADPSRPLYLQGSAARMLALPGDRSLPLQAEDSAAGRAD
jgi:endonuclease-3